MVLMEQVVGSGGCVCVGHLVGRLMGCGFGYQMPSMVVGWGVLGSVVMAFGFDSGCMFEFLGAVVSAWIAVFSMMCLLLQVAKALYGLTTNGGSRKRLQLCCGVVRVVVGGSMMVPGGFRGVDLLLFLKLGGRYGEGILLAGPVDWSLRLRLAEGG